jgi:ATP-dependent protease ClpP protease subunit
MRNLPTFKLERPELPANSFEDDTFRVFCKRSGGTVQIAIMDAIGDDGYGGGVRAENVAGTLRDNPSSPVTVRINSPGGLAYDGLMIFNALANHDGEVTTINEGLAYSAASIIFMAGDTRKVFEASDFGIHRAHGFAMGNVNQMLAVATFLEGLDNHLISIYSAGTGMSEKQIEGYIDGTTNGIMGTMFSGAEAVEAGFADELIPNKTRGKARSKMEELAAANSARAFPLALQARRDSIDTLLGNR